LTKVLHKESGDQIGKLFKSTRLDTETRQKVINTVKLKLLYVDNDGLKEIITEFYLGLVDDLEFVSKFSIERDRDVFTYVLNKAKHELTETNMRILTSRIASDVMRTPFRMED